MSEVFDPEVELERIWTLRELMLECRKRVPDILERVDELLTKKDMSPMETIAVCEMVLNRGFGKSRQHHVVSSDAGGEKQVKVYIPDNNRRQPHALTVIDHQPESVRSNVG